MDNPEKLAAWTKNNHTTQYVLDTTTCKQTQKMYVRHELFYTQLEVKTNRTWLVML
jgi:hypothetical protein